MGFFRLAKGGLIFVFVMLFIGVISLLLGQYVFVGETWAWHPLSLLNFGIFYLTSFPAVFVTVNLFKPLGIIGWSILDAGQLYDIKAWLVFLLINSIFWYLVTCIFTRIAEIWYSWKHRSDNR